jgi:hypothetical protein
MEEALMANPIALRPFLLPHVGNYYFPEGLPRKSSHPVVDSVYQTLDGEEFHICYTMAQVDRHFDTFGIFCPHTPLFISGGSRA